MKTKMFVLMIVTLFWTISYSQDKFALVDQPADFELVAHTQNLKYAFGGQFSLDESTTDNAMAEKMTPGGKGALIGFGIGATLGGLAGAAMATGIDATTTIISLGTQSNKPYAAWIVGGAAALGALGAGLGAIIGSSTKNKTQHQNVHDQNTLVPGLSDAGLSYYPAQPETTIISLSHNF